MLVLLRSCFEWGATATQELYEIDYEHCTDHTQCPFVDHLIVWLLVQVIDRILYKLDELVRPFVHKILVVIEPLLIDEDYYARVEGREIIANLSKAAGLATMIAAMRPDIDNIDE